MRLGVNPAVFLARLLVELADGVFKNPHRLTPLNPDAEHLLDLVDDLVLHIRVRHVNRRLLHRLFDLRAQLFDCVHHIGVRLFAFLRLRSEGFLYPLVI